MKKTKLQKMLIQKHKLKDKQMITKESLEEISNEENIELKDLILILGCYNGILYKNPWQYTRLDFSNQINIKNQVKLIKMDLKYLEDYGKRSYNKEEIENICQEYEITLENFLTYIYPRKICFYENMEIISNNSSGIWIGDAPCLSSYFLERNYKILNQKVIEIAKRLSRIYGTNNEDELIDIGMNKILNLGNIERNLSFDEERIIGKLLYKARFCMIDYSIKNIVKIQNIDNTNMQYYEHYYEENNIEDWLYPISFNFKQRLIIQELIRNLYNEEETRWCILRKIYMKLKISRTSFFEELYKIKQLLLEFNKVKICCDGSVIKGE